MEYWEHPSYGKEVFDKAVTITFKTPLTKKQAGDLFDNAPQLDEKFPDLAYTDGALNGTTFDHGWEKTDTIPRGLINYEISKNQITVTATDAISPALFIQAVKHVLSETAKTVNAEVEKVGTNGLAVGYSGNTLSEVASSIDIARRQFKGPAKNRGMQP